MLDTQTITDVNEILDEAEESMRKGRYQDAYELCCRATRLMPGHMDAWLLRAGLTTDLKEKQECINRAAELGMSDEDRHHVGFFTLKESLEDDPFLAYKEETDGMYRVENDGHTQLSIPKKREAVTSYPDRPTDPLHGARRWLALAVFGLLTAGLGTLLFAPLAAWFAFDAGARAHNPLVRADSTVLVLLSALIFVLGVVFSALLALHLIG